MRVRTLAISATLAGFLVSTAAHAETLNLLIWESYIDQKILDRFTETTGVAVNQIFYDSGDARDEILSDPNSNIDLAVVGENGAELFGKRGILEGLTQANVPSLTGYRPDWNARCAGYGLPYLWGTMGIVYRSDKVKTTPTSWTDLMVPAPELKKHIAMYDDHNEAFIAPLVLLGKSINANDTETLKAAFEVMKTQAPFVLTYDYVITSIQNPDTGKEIYMAIAYSGDQHVLNEKAGTPGVWRYAVPKEGTLSWLDCLAVTADSPRKAQALQLLDFIGSPENAAANALALTMPTASEAALPLIPADMLNDPEIYTPADILAKSQYQKELSVQSIQTRRRIISAMANFQ
ncbi:polyamine ABC transporter substrate-binding protein [Pararhizobium antarcticum]|uniref:Spermidine/putrescine ABC transporter substrate-binding protein n=1 Tax=Pararhizobium antarcticum TaxID=1798805 RepID=A0A657LPJ8_9HYPH|nr:spermidine/putrescine ABC transporter substrate-binding protein [Pararhizobium antarcticum]OJF94004.1 spermidine/putrescine ABC transporter substrate-binding protein [Pararhizobium antarcticum]OJF97502.1 spermidine/putrescine ABC transporter substrate-binding protein [Rhizobium sp. 58]